MYNFIKNSVVFAAAVGTAFAAWGAAAQVNKPAAPTAGGASTLGVGASSAAGGAGNSSYGLGNSATGHWRLHERITPRGTFIFGTGTGSLSNSALGAFSTGGGSTSASVGSGTSTSGAPTVANPAGRHNGAGLARRGFAKRGGIGRQGRRSRFGHPERSAEFRGRRGDRERPGWDWSRRGNRGFERGPRGYGEGSSRMRDERSSDQGGGR